MPSVIFFCHSITAIGRGFDTFLGVYQLDCGDTGGNRLAFRGLSDEYDGQRFNSFIITLVAIIRLWLGGGVF